MDISIHLHHGMKLTAQRSAPLLATYIELTVMKGEHRRDEIVFFLHYDADTDKLDAMCAAINVAFAPPSVVDAGFLQPGGPSHD